VNGAIKTRCWKRKSNRGRKQREKEGRERMEIGMERGDGGVG
jgi:hypothetical protein